MSLSKGHDPKLAVIVLAIDKKGIPFKTFSEIMGRSAKAGKVEMSNFNMVFNSAYGKIKDADCEYIANLC